MLFYALALVGVLLVLGVGGLLLAERFFPPRLEPLATNPLASPTPSPTLGTGAVVDPVTRQELDPAQAVYQVDLYGTTFYFASRESLERFREDPLRYVQPRVRIRVDLTDLQSEAEPGSGPPAGTSPADSWLDPVGPPPPIEEGRPGTSTAEPPGEGEAFEPHRPGESSPSAEMEDSEPVLPDGEPGWLPGPGSTLPPQVPASEDPAIVAPEDEDIILDERAP